MGALGVLVIMAAAIGYFAYFAPSFLGMYRRVPDPWPLFVINLFAGWTLVGWVVALVLAVRDFGPSFEVDRTRRPLSPLGMPLALSAAGASMVLLMFSAVFWIGGR
ncbi:MAG: superinfection immunity protein [Acidimicrobiales bacterium]